MTGSRTPPALTRIADAGLADSGRARVAWAEKQMPVLRSVRERFTRERPLEDLSVAACLHVTAETAVLAGTLAAGGASVAVTAANPFSTQDDAAAVLAADGLAVHAVRGDVDAYAAGIQALAAAGPDLVLDDGADLVLAVDGPLRGAIEETTTGLLRLRRSAPDFPVLAVNEALTERTFNDRFGSGQSVLDGILRATNVLLAGHTTVVLGYGWTGRGVAQRARGMGASVIVCEVDPIRALEARMEGYEVLPAVQAAARGDIFITVTGSRDVLTAEHFAEMKDGAMLANAGHFDVEIDLAALRAEATGGVREARPLVREFDLGGRRLYLLADGRVVNLAAAEGHPAAVMDVSFALQALCAAWLARETPPPGVQAVPDAIDREVARLKLESLGVGIDELTDAQRRYRLGWTAGA